MVSARADGAEAEKRVRSQMQAMGLFMAVTVLLLVLPVALGKGQAWPMVVDEDRECKVWLVQSIPTDMPELPPVPTCCDGWRGTPPRDWTSLRSIGSF